MSRFAPAPRRAAIHRALASDGLREVGRMDALAPQNLEALARMSLMLLLASGAGYLALDLVAGMLRGSDTLLAGSSPLARGLALLAANVAGYIVVLPLHEAVHAAVILALGGRPRFGHKLPLALYCTAPGQLFTREGYAAVALAPLVVLGAAGIAVAIVSPVLGACLALAFVGNVAGAVGDLAAYARLRQLPRDVLIADTESGFVAYAVEDDAPSGERAAG